LEKINQFIEYSKPLSNNATELLLNAERSIGSGKASHEPVLPLPASIASTSSALKAVSRVDRLFHLTDLATEKAALRVFDRLMHALAPESIKKTLGKTEFTSVTQYEASLYRAYKEKYQRIKRYSDSKKLVSDLRVCFKQSLKDELSKAGEI